MKPGTELTDLGLPVGEASGRFGPLAFDHLVFNLAARTLIAVLRERKVIAGAYHLFVRELVEQRYRRVVLPDGVTHVSDVATAEEAAVAIAVLQAWQPMPIPNSDAYGIDNLGVARIDLPRGSITMLAPVIGKPGSRSIWVSRLLSVAADGQSYVAVLANERGIGPGRSTVDYAVMRVAAASGESELLGDLSMPFA